MTAGLSSQSDRKSIPGAQELTVRKCCRSSKIHRQRRFRMDFAVVARAVKN
ncbi:hypothetical protein HMPREF1548_04925 [Clostridium sp. KLE 1755]|nr:hypothetical protein HMPREF1548_04925 [Clostridium sp. KLE 1755]